MSEPYELLARHLVVLDSSGKVVAITPRGQEFATINAQDVHVGDDYLAICKAGAATGDRDLAAALEGIKAVYDGKTKCFEMEHGYKSGADQRCFQMSVTPLAAPGKGVVISHEDVTLRKRHEQAIRELSGRLINAQEQERSRIARELHDDISQQVAVLTIGLQLLKSEFATESSEEGDRIEDLLKKTHTLSIDIQRLSHRLHSSKLAFLGIVAALRGLCAEVSEQSKIEVEFQCGQVPAVVDSDTSLSLFRVAQESLHNIAKHAHARRVQVSLLGDNNGIVLRQSDDGVGFDPEAPEHKAGLGMVSMKERIRLLGGVLSVFSTPSMGTTIETRVPFLLEMAAISDIR